MRRLGPCLLLLLLSAEPASLTPPSCKPAAPIDLDARLIGDSVSATATSRLGGDVELEILLPEGVAHVAGPRKLQGRRCEARLEIRPQDRTRREILVRATTVHGGAVMTKVVPLVLFDGPVPAPGTPAKNSRGEALLEFPP